MAAAQVPPAVAVLANDLRQNDQAANRAAMAPQNRAAVAERQMPPRLRALAQAAVNSAPDDVIHNIGYVATVCNHIKTAASRDRAQFRRMCRDLQPASPLRLPGQVELLKLPWVVAHDAQLQQAQPDANQAWDYAFSSIAGVVVMDSDDGDRSLGVAVMHAGVVVDPDHFDHPYLSASLVGMDNRLAARLLALGIMATTYDACTDEDTRTTLSAICADICATMNDIVRTSGTRGCISAGRPGPTPPRPPPSAVGGRRQEWRGRDGV